MLTFRMTGSVADCKDLAQETFVRADWQLDSSNATAKFSSRLYGIAVIACLDWPLAKRFNAGMNLQVHGKNRDAVTM